MPTVPTAKRLTIFEGPDGAGKSTAARWLAETTGARYVHCGPLRASTKSLARYYAEAMWPALMGYQDVVMDRCWLSENPYGRVYRGGEDRIGPTNTAMLETLAMRCSTLVVLCLPPWEFVRTSFVVTRANQMLDDVGQLRAVYDAYEAMRTRLPVMRYDYTRDDLAPFRALDTGAGRAPPSDALRTRPHWRDRSTAGLLAAGATVVVTDPPEHRNGEMWYRYPGVSFRPDSPEWWLMGQLAERDLVGRVLWASAQDDGLKYLLYGGQDVDLGASSWRYVALGAGSNELHRAGIQHRVLESALFHRDVRGGDTAHPLVGMLLEERAEA